MPSWGGTAAVVPGLIACSSEKEGGQTAKAEAGVWKTHGCIYNCSCGNSKCLSRIYVEDGVPLKIRTDESETDTLANPRRIACPRGRAQISNKLSPARIKYPMKRKNWSPEAPNGELRGIDGNASLGTKRLTMPPPNFKRSLTSTPPAAFFPSLLTSAV